MSTQGGREEDQGPNTEDTGFGVWRKQTVRDRLGHTMGFGCQAHGDP